MPRACRWPRERLCPSCGSPYSHRGSKCKRCYTRDYRSRYGVVPMTLNVTADIVRRIDAKRRRDGASRNETVLTLLEWGLEEEGW
jgi:predicted amidophosphoribosyltransferase